MMKDYQTIVNQLGRIMKAGSLELKDKETLYYVRRKYYNKLKLNIHEEHLYENLATFQNHNPPPSAGNGRLFPGWAVLARFGPRPVQILPYRILYRRKILSRKPEPQHRRAGGQRLLGSMDAP